MEYVAPRRPRRPKRESRVPKALILVATKYFGIAMLFQISYILVPWYRMSGGPIWLTLDSYL